MILQKLSRSIFDKIQSMNQDTTCDAKSSCNKINTIKLPM